MESRNVQGCTIALDSLYVSLTGRDVWAQRLSREVRRKKRSVHFLASCGSPRRFGPVSHVSFLGLRPFDSGFLNGSGLHGERKGGE